MFKIGLRLIRKGREDSDYFKRVALELHRRLGLKPWHENVFDLTIDDEAPDDPYEYALWKRVMDLRKALMLAT